MQAEEPTIAFAFASVVAIKNIKVGDLLTEENIWLMRPGGGDFGVLDYEKLLGRRAAADMEKGYQVKRQNVEL